MTNLTYSQAKKGANIFLILALICSCLLGVALGVLFNPALVQFIELLTKIIKSC